MLSTLRKLLRPDETELQGQDAYNGCAAQARNPVFYRALGVPDTLDGRYEMIVLHVWLQLTRMKEADTPEHTRALIEAFFADMDQNLREFGIDMGIKKRMRAMADGYHGRITAYDAAFAEPDDAALTEAFTRNIYGTLETAANPTNIAALCAYARSAASNQTALASEWPAIS